MKARMPLSEASLRSCLILHPPPHARMGAGECWHGGLGARDPQTSKLSRVQSSFLLPLPAVPHSWPGSIPPTSTLAVPSHAHLK
jgi:hypothetical protein